jgi:hypothetical protein
MPTPYGYHAASALDPKKLFAIGLYVTGGTAFDIWLDDFAFYP